MDIYRSRFVKYPTAGINCLAFSHSSSNDFHDGDKTTVLRLAVGRANGDIEIWNPQSGNWLQETIFKGGKDRSVEGLVWTQEPADTDREGRRVSGALRLFSIGYSSTVTEWNLATGLPLRHWSGNASEVWCLAAQPRAKPVKASGSLDRQDLVAGCADGSLVLLTTENGDLQYQSYLARTTSKKARVLSITFQSRNCVVAGFSDSTIRVYSIREGKLIRNITLGAGTSGGPKNILVWAVKCLPNGDIVSGDSQGEVRVFDGKQFSQLSRISSHESDILDLAVSKHGHLVFSASMDRRTAKYMMSTWRSRLTKAIHATHHEHDVKVMATYESDTLDVIASGGIDTNLVIVPIKAYENQYQLTLSGLPQVPPIDSTVDRAIVISWWERELAIWKIFDRNMKSRKRHQLRTRIAVKGDENITSATISPNGELVVIATASDVKVFLLTKEKANFRARYRPEKRASLGSSGARLVRFSPDGEWVACISHANHVHLYKLSSNAEFQGPFTLTRRKSPKFNSPTPLGAYMNLFRHVIFSPDSKMLIASQIDGRIESWVLDITAQPASRSSSKRSRTETTADESSDEEESPSHGWMLNPRLKFPTTMDSCPLAMLFRPQEAQESTGGTNSYNLFVLTAKHRLWEVDMNTGLFTDWCRRNPKGVMPRAFTQIKDRAMAMFVGSKGWIWIYGASWIFGLNIDVNHSKETSDDNDAVVGVQTNLLQGKKRKWQSTSGAGDTKREHEVQGLVPISCLNAQTTGMIKDRHVDAMEIDHDKQKRQGPGQEAVDSDLHSDGDDDDDDDDDEIIEGLRGGNEVADSDVDATKPKWFLTHRYRPILGIVSVHPATEDEPPEVMLVERPIWSLNLPPRYDKAY